MYRLLRPYVVIGAIFIIAGVVTLIRPQYGYRVDQHSVQLGKTKVEFETRKIIRFPLWFSIPILTIGAALVIGGLRDK